MHPEEKCGTPSNSNSSKKQIAPERTASPLVYPVWASRSILSLPRLSLYVPKCTYSNVCLPLHDVDYLYSHEQIVLRAERIG